MRPELPESMLGKCPNCFGISPDMDSCATCNGTGSATFRFAQGELWTRDCTSYECGRNVEGTFRGPPSEEELANPEPCLFCDSPTKWSKR